MEVPMNQHHGAHLVDSKTAETLNVLGPTVRFLAGPAGSDDSPCVMEGTIPPEGIVPLHSHADPEIFLPVSGELEGLSQANGNFEWVRVAPGAIFHVPPNARHAWRNPARVPAVVIIVTTARMARFFREIGTPYREGEPPKRPTNAALAHFQEVSKRYGYWNATAEENARAGITLPDA
jgi:mannose-6-phosphate isomerase-like protein (cupin superfamily)